jgi:hypothetical protein
LPVAGVVDVDWGDMNHDGFVDIVMVQGDPVVGYTLVVHFSEAPATAKFCEQQSTFFTATSTDNSFATLLNGSYKAGSLFLADLDIDGFPDIITV